jgi:predicted phosphodiesterase
MPLPLSPIARAGLLGDLHGEDAALALALRVFADEGVDRVLAVGDICDGPGDVDRCCALLAEANAAVVRGNHERWLLAGTMRELPDATLALGAEARAYLAALPATMRMETVAGELLLCHGLEEDDMAVVDPDDWYSLQQNERLHALVEREEPLVVVNGHSHRRLLWCKGRLSLINAGTLYRNHDPCFAIVDFGVREITYFDLRNRGARAIRTEALPIPPPRGRR